MLTRYLLFESCRFRSLRQAGAGSLLTNVFRMLIKWRSFNRAKSGTIQFQSIMRGHNIRRMLASVKVQTHYRMYILQKKFVSLKSAILALQCATRFRAAKKIFTELMKEQKDVGKLKQNNEKLKQEMGSLRAMLSAQAKEGAASETHNREIAEKQKRIAELERRVAEIERELEIAKKMVDKLENDLVLQKENATKEIEQTKQNRQRRTSTTNESPNQSHRKHASSVPEGIPVDYVSPEVLAEHRSRVATLEEELDYERKLRHQTDGEIIKLRAASNGVKLNDEDVSALLAPQLSSISRSGTVSEESSFADGNTPARVRYVNSDRLLLPVIFSAWPL
jgi:myosin heavy subunit